MVPIASYMVKSTRNNTPLKCEGLRPNVYDGENGSLKNIKIEGDNNAGFNRIY